MSAAPLTTATAALEGRPTVAPAHRSAAPADESPRESQLNRDVETEPPPPSEEVRAELQGDLDRVSAVGTEVCRLLGITSTWGAAHWEPGATRDTLQPTYRVTVRGDVPDESVTAVLVRRLARHGWSGAVTSHEPIMRLDAHRDVFALCLTAEGSIVRLTVRTQPVRLGRTLATWILAGVYEDDEIA